MTTRRRHATTRRRALPLVACLTLLGALPPVAAVARQDAAPSSPDPAWIDTTISRSDRTALDALIGKPLPAIPGSTRTLGAEAPSELRGKAVLLHTWSRTSRLSERILDDLAYLAKRYSDDLVVLAVHPRGGADGVDAYLSKRDTPFTVLVDQSGEYLAAIGLGDRPLSILADKSGVIRFAGLNAKGVRDAVDSLASETYSPPAVTTRRPTRAAPAANYPPYEGEIKGARDLRGKRAPAIEVQQWLTAPAQTSGKVVIVDFWATWCGPCVRMIPHMNDLAAAFPDDLAVVGVSNEDAETVRRFMRNTEMKYPVAVDQQGRMMRAVEVRSIPHVMVVSPDGVVRWQGHPGLLSTQLVQQIINAAKSAT